jgi:hypothetical protein
VASADSRDGTPNGFHILSVDGNGYAAPIVSVATASITTVLRIVCLLEICLLRAAKVSRLRFTMTVAARRLSITML